MYHQNRNTINLSKQYALYTEDDVVWMDEPYSAGLHVADGAKGTWHADISVSLTKRHIYHNLRVSSMHSNAQLMDTIDQIARYNGMAYLRVTTCRLSGLRLVVMFRWYFAVIIFVMRILHVLYENIQTFYLAKPSSEV